MSEKMWASRPNIHRHMSHGNFGPYNGWVVMREECGPQDQIFAAPTTVSDRKQRWLWTMKPINTTAARNLVVAFVLSCVRVEADVVPVREERDMEMDREDDS